MRLRFVVLMAATGLTFAYWDTLWNTYEKWTRPPGQSVAVNSDVEYYCPMHPHVVQSEPGQCPTCGMPLSARKPGAAEALPEGVTARVALSPARIAQAGIQTVETTYRPLSETVTTVGSVTVDERLRARISSKTNGEARVERLFVNYTGTPVKKGEPLAEMYSPELYQAVRELLIAQKAARERPSTGGRRSLLGSPVDLLASAREKLRLWGITPEQTEGILRSGKADWRLPILSPIGGVVLEKNVVEGQYVSEGDPMFEVADLSHVWIIAQVYEDQIGLVKVGQSVEARVDAFPGLVFRGQVAFLDPVLNPATRTLRVRYDVENPEGKLRPGMFATVTFRVPVADRPAFAGRQAKPSEGHTHAHAVSAEEQEICPVTTLKLGSMGKPVAVEVKGRKVWTCCPACPPKLKATPATYLVRLETAPEDEVLTVPESAVIDTGTRSIVYVETEPGVFEGREVVLGPPSDGLYPVISGLAPGARVAAAGSFLIDAETRLKASTGSGGSGHSHPEKTDEVPEGPKTHEHVGARS
jgi:Cu(I)/Ag(I) efflux system membrane fusion protein